MNDADVMYPLLCPTNCGYNFCVSCVEHLLESSKDAYQMASDGNRHVKIWLKCPQCRGDLTHTINDTILLRKAKTAERYLDVADSELNASELRWKHEYVTIYAKDVQHAELRTIKYFQEHDKQLPPPLRTESNTTIRPDETPFIDTTLFQGLEFAMSDDEQLYVQNLLLSGQPDLLASATQILHGILQLTLQGMTPKLTSSSQQRTRNQQRTDIEKMAQFRKQYPLPARMVKYFVLPTFPALKKKVISFREVLWDGNLADAFVRNGKPSSIAIVRKNPAIASILRRDENQNNQGNKISTESFVPQNQIQIASVNGAAGRLGLQVGDVVTHIGGEPFKGTAQDLKELLSRMYEEDSLPTFSMIVNADDCIARVLQLRAQSQMQQQTKVAQVENF
jgi:PDZ domain